MPLRWPFSSRSNSVCQKFSSSVIFFAAMLFVSKSLSTVSSRAVIGFVASAIFLSSSALAFASSSLNGAPLAAAILSRKLAVKVSFHFSRCVAISASSVVTFDSTFFFSAKADARAASISFCRSSSMTDETVSRKSSSASGCAMVMPMSAATTIRRENCASFRAADW